MRRAKDGEIKFRLVLFGGPSLSRDGTPIPISKMQGSLLGLLYGDESTFLTRERVISLLWPDIDPPVARRRLNQLLYSLKKKTGEPTPFTIVGEEIHRAQDRCDSDLEDFEAWIEEERYRSCFDLVRKGLLPRLTGWYTNQLTDWISTRQNQCVSLLCQGAKETLAEAEECSRWKGALQAASVLTDLNPVEEEFLRHMMLAEARVSGLTAAKKVFRNFRSTYEGMMGLEWNPEKETLNLLEGLETNLSRFQPPSSESGGTAKKNPIFIGREGELTLLRRALMTPPHQSLRAILVSGEAGIGKSRIVREALAGTHLDQVSIFFSKAGELETLITLNPLIEAFRGEEVRNAITGLGEPWRTVMYGIMPRHFPGEGRVPEAPTIQPGNVPRRLFEAFHQLILRLTEQKPAVLALDDLQWADETTFSVLDFLLSRWDQGRFQLLLSVRSEDIRKNNTAHRFLQALKGHGDFLEVNLNDLSAHSAADLIRETAREELPENRVTSLRSLGGGNPFFLIELTLEMIDGRLEGMVTSDSPLSIPVSIRQVLQRRFTAISAEAEQLLAAIAVYGRPVGLDEIIWITRLSTEETLNAVDQLHSFRLIRYVESLISSQHELIRQAAYQNLTPPRRAWLHERVARQLERGEGQPPVDELAFHFHMAGCSSEALGLCIEAADRAEKAGAIPEALRFLEMAREHTIESEQAAGILARIGDLHFRNQDMIEAAPVLDLAARRLRKENMDLEALEAELGWVEAVGVSGVLPYRDCQAEIARITEEAEEIGHFETIIRALDLEIHLADNFNDPTSARRVLATAVAFQDAECLDVRCRAHAILALNHYFGDPEQGLTSARNAVEIAMQVGEPDVQLLALNRLLVVLLYRGELHKEEGNRVLRTAEDLFSSSGDLMLKFFIRLNRAVWHMEVGELDHAKQTFPKAESVIQGTRARTAWLHLLLNRAELEYLLGEVSESHQSYLEAESMLPNPEPPSYRATISAGLGLCALHMGKIAEARRRETEIPDLNQAWTFDPSVIARFRSEILRMRGDIHAAEGTLADIAQEIEGRFTTGWLKLMLERASILSRRYPSKAKEVSRLGLKKSRELGLEVREREFSGFLSLQNLN